MSVFRYGKDVTKNNFKLLKTIYIYTIAYIQYTRYIFIHKNIPCVGLLKNALKFAVVT